MVPPSRNCTMRRLRMPRACAMDWALCPPRRFLLPFLESVAEPLEDLVSRYARTHIPFTAQQAAEHFSRLTPVGVGVLTPVLQRLHQQRRLSSGEFLPEVLRALGSAGVEWVDAQVLRTIRARSLGGVA